MIAKSRNCASSEVLRAGAYNNLSDIGLRMWARTSRCPRSDGLKTCYAEDPAGKLGRINASVAVEHLLYRFPPLGKPVCRPNYSQVLFFNLRAVQAVRFGILFSHQRVCHVYRRHRV